MSGADLFEDGYPHGTVEGFNNGCRGGSCPGALEYDLSCKQAKILHASDVRYDRLVAAGKTPTEISDIINGRTPATSPEEPTMLNLPAPPKNTQSAAQPLAERAHDTEPQEDAGAPAIETDAPAEGTPAAEAEAMGHPTGFETFEKRKSPAGPPQSVVREWAHENGVEVNPRGSVRKDVVDAYLAAHASELEESSEDASESPETLHVTPAEFPEALEQTRARLAADDVAAAALANQQQHHDEIAQMFTDEIWGNSVQELVATAVDELQLHDIPAHIPNDHRIGAIKYENLPHPEWAEVAALDLTLHKWAQERIDKGAARISLAITAEKLHQAHHFIDDLGTIVEGLTRVIEAKLQQPVRRTWWKRRR